MKTLILLIMVALLATSCTDNQRARNYGGTEEIDLPKGQRLVNATWKGDEIWYLTEPMPESYAPQTKTFREKSSYGIMEGELIFHESK